MCVWLAQGVRSVPKRLRIRISRRRNDDEEAKVGLSFRRSEAEPAHWACHCSSDAKHGGAGYFMHCAFLKTRRVTRQACVSQEELYSYVTVSDDQTFKGKGTTVVEES